MKTKKCARILCLLLCFMFLLVSCGDNDDDTSSEAVESGESVVETVSDKVSRDESSEESSEEPSNDESSEEPSEPDYQVEMTEEMMRAYLELKLVSYPLEHMLANHEENYNYKDDYTAFGNLNGYTLCGICPRITYGSGIPARFPLTCVAGDYVFLHREIEGLVDFCLYKDNEFIFLKNAYKKGLFDGKDAYELIRSNEKYKEYAQKLSDIDYQFEMTEEMADTFLKFTKRDYKTAAEMLDDIKKAYPQYEYDYNYDYVAFGNLNGYTFCFIPSYFMSAVSNPMSSCYIAGDYVFINRGPEQYMSLVNLYLYKDMSFITFEDAYEQGMFNPEDAYKLITRDPQFAHMSKKLSDLSEDEVETYRSNHESLIKFYKRTK